MRELKMYKLKSGIEFFNIIIEEEDYYEVYMGCEEYSGLMYMFALLKAETLENVKEMVEAENQNYYAQYIAEYITKHD